MEHVLSFDEYLRMLRIVLNNQNLPEVMLVVEV